MALLGSSPAQATFPGANGKLATVAGGDIHLINPDGTGDVPLTPGPAADDAPAWSPDGARIAFQRDHNIYVMNADGSNVTQLTTHFGDDDNPAWSPDGTKIAFDSDRGENGNRDVYVMNADGSGIVRLTTDPELDQDPSWSPDGTKIAFSSNRESYACEDPGNPLCYVRPTSRIFTMNPDGTGVTRRIETVEPDGCGDGQDAFAPDWSPDSRYISYEWTEADFCKEGNFHGVDSEAGGVHSEFVDFGSVRGGSSWSPDGREIAFFSFTNSSLMAAAPSRADTRTIVMGHRWPSWQPIPINAYARPKGASPIKISLVPAYQQCTAPNTQHGAPLSSPSCTPPARISSSITVGTPDANLLTPNSVGSAILTTRVDNLATPADESDVKLRMNVTDVRRASDLGDYTGQLEARPVFRITDKDNTPGPGGPGAATTQPVPFPYPVACAATAATNIGATCATTTTAEAVLPGSITGGLRAVWELERFDVNDGTGALFLRPGVFAP